MRQKLQAGATLEFLTPAELKGELHDSLGHQMDALVRRELRGIDYLAISGNADGADTVTINEQESGYTWSVKTVGAQLAAAGVLSIYRGSSTTAPPLGTTTALSNGSNFDAVYKWSSNQIEIKDQSNLTLYSASGINAYIIMVEQVPTEMQGKL